MHTVVGVLRGGPSREHEVSLKTGASMLAHLPQNRFVSRDIYIDRQGVWHDRGRAAAPERVLRQLDVALIALHGEYGEDGQVQRLLEQFGVPYAGADSFASYLAMHKLMAKIRAKEAGLLTPEFHLIEGAENAAYGAAEAVRRFPQPVVVKPIGWGSSVGVSIVGGYAPVLAAIERNFKEGASAVLIEELIKGREATVGVVEGLRGEEFYTLPLIEIVPPDGDFFSYESKYNGKSAEIVPAHFSRMADEELARAARLMHRTLGVRHYSRSDFIVSPKGVYYLETNTLPALTEEAPFTRALESVGISLDEFLDHAIDRALK